MGRGVAVREDEGGAGQGVQVQSVTKTRPRKRSSHEAGMDSEAEEEDVTSPLKTAAAETEIRDEVGARRNLDAAMSECANTVALMVRQALQQYHLRLKIWHWRAPSRVQPRRSLWRMSHNETSRNNGRAALP